MRKFITVLALLCFIMPAVFAQEDALKEVELVLGVNQPESVRYKINVPEGFLDFQNRVYMEEGILLAGGTIEIEYSPKENEARIFYTCLMTQFERGEAMNVVLEVIQDFMALTNYQNVDGDVLTKEKYTRYTYMAPEKEKYFRDGKLKKGQYIAQLKFNK